MAKKPKDPAPEKPEDDNKWRLELRNWHKINEDEYGRTHVMHIDIGCLVRYQNSITFVKDATLKHFGL